MLARLGRSAYRQARGWATHRPWVFLITDGAPTDQFATWPRRSACAGATTPSARSRSASSRSACEGADMAQAGADLQPGPAAAEAAGPELPRAVHVAFELAGRGGAVAARPAGGAAGAVGVVRRCDREEEVADGLRLVDRHLACHRSGSPCQDAGRCSGGRRPADGDGGTPGGGGQRRGRARPSRSDVGVGLGGRSTSWSVSATRRRCPGPGPGVAIDRRSSSGGWFAERAVRLIAERSAERGRGRSVADYACTLLAVRGGQARRPCRSRSATAPSSCRRRSRARLLLGVLAPARRVREQHVLRDPGRRGPVALQLERSGPRRTRSPCSPTASSAWCSTWPAKHGAFAPAFRPIFGWLAGTEPDRCGAPSSGVGRPTWVPSRSTGGPTATRRWSWRPGRRHRRRRSSP